MHYGKKEIKHGVRYPVLEKIVIFFFAETHSLMKP